MSSIFVRCKVVPKSSKQGFIADAVADAKCYLKSQPEDGKANRELVQLMAKILKIPQSDITIVQGATARNKLLKIQTDMTKEQVLVLLGVVAKDAQAERQQKLF